MHIKRRERRFLICQFRRLHALHRLAAGAVDHGDYIRIPLHRVKQQMRAIGAGHQIQNPRGGIDGIKSGEIRGLAVSVRILPERKAIDAEPAGNGAHIHKAAVRGVGVKHKVTRILREGASRIEGKDRARLRIRDRSCPGAVHISVHIFCHPDFHLLRFQHRDAEHAIEPGRNGILSDELAVFREFALHLSVPVKPVPRQRDGDLQRIIRVVIRQADDAGTLRAVRRLLVKLPVGAFHAALLVFPVFLQIVAADLHISEVDGAGELHASLFFLKNRFFGKRRKAV